MRAALVQLCSGDDPARNLEATTKSIRAAAMGGADIVLTPECTNILAASRPLQAERLTTEHDDITLAACCGLARELGVWIVLGSLALKAGPPDQRFVNRCFAISPDGGVAARYDKIHMFDVVLGDGERYQESAAYRPGEAAVTVEALGTRLGLTICYDLRFSALYRDLAQAGASIMTVPAAFTVPTGEAHWHVLLRARAIETGSFVLAAAQTGTHNGNQPRGTYGHSLAVSPWGEVLLDAGTEEGVSFVELDLSAVDKARERVPSLSHGRRYTLPS